MFLFGIAIIVKMVYIQVKEGPQLAEKAQKQEIRLFSLKADRGNILSANGELLATSVPVFELRMDVGSPYISDNTFYSNVDSLAVSLHNLFGKHSTRFYKRLLVKARKKGNRFLLLKRRVSYEQLKRIRQFPILRKGKIRGGLITFQQTKRKLPFGMLAARTIGYEIKSQNLKVGIEGAYNSILTGVDGKQLRRRLNHNAWIPIHSKNEKEPHNGEDIVTTIDVNLQDVAENALRKQLIKHKARMGCAVLMQVQTGDIKAIANLSYNPSNGEYDEVYNMAVGKKYEPGSTFKLASIIAVLEDHKVKLSDTISVGKGYAVYYGRTLRDVHAMGDGRITVREAFEHSSNVGISKIIYNSYKKNPAKFIKRLYQMSLNKPLGIKIPGEARPYIKSPEDKKYWYLTSLPWMSVGYELELTPLQILTFYNAVANNGVEVKPRFVKEITEGGTVVKKFPVRVRNSQIASSEVIKKVRSLLEGVVLRGTAQNLKNKHFTIAGKTGTAKISENGKYINAYNATFVGYFPADNPKYSCIVVINRPKNGYYGSAAAAPVFKEIADKVYATSLAFEKTYSDTSSKEKSLPAIYHPAWYPDLKTIYSYLQVNQQNYLANESWAVVLPDKKNNRVVFKPVDFKPKVIPNLKGMKAIDAVYILGKMGLKADLKGIGIVYSQSLKPGAYYKKGQLVQLRLTKIN